MDKYLKFLKRVNKTEREKLAFLIENIVAGNLRGLGPKKLKGFKNLYRVRQGKIRIVYKKEKEINVIINIDYRGKIYKNR